MEFAVSNIEMLLGDESQGTVKKNEVEVVDERKMVTFVGPNLAMVVSAEATIVCSEGEITWTSCPVLTRAGKTQ